MWSLRLTAMMLGIAGSSWASEQTGASRWLDAVALADLLTDWGRTALVVELREDRPSLRGAWYWRPELRGIWSTQPSDLVLIVEDAELNRRERQALEALQAMGLRVWLSRRDPAAWRRQHLPVADPHSTGLTPKQRPFVIPLGICERNTPVMELRPEHFPEQRHE